MSNRFHNKFHRHNHHTAPTDRDGLYPDSAYDPIASRESPFQGEFYSVDQITTTDSVLVGQTLSATNGRFTQNVRIDNFLTVFNDISAARNIVVDRDVWISGNLTVLGDTTQLDTLVYATSALSVVNSGTGPAVFVKQTGNQPVAQFFDDNIPALVIDGRDSAPGYVGINTLTPNEQLTIVGNVSGDNLRVSFNKGLATGDYTFAANQAKALGLYSFATNTGEASGSHSSAHGDNTKAVGFAAHSEGAFNTAFGNATHVEGFGNIAFGDLSHVEGGFNYALEIYSHAEGTQTTAAGSISHTEGYLTATGKKVNFETFTKSTNVFTFLPANSGFFDFVVPNTRLITFVNNVGYDFVVANRNTTNGNISAVSVSIPANVNSGSRYIVTKSGNFSHAEGYLTEASGFTSHAEGNRSFASGFTAHAEGSQTEAKGFASHSEGNLTIALGNESHAEGYNTQANSFASHSEGNVTIASGFASHAEGTQTLASGNESHAEGYLTKAQGFASHAEGNQTVASGLASHAEGDNTSASGDSSHSEGLKTTASGNYSHTEGYRTSTGRDWPFEYASGPNLITFSNTVSANFAFVTPGDSLRIHNLGGLGDSMYVIPVASRNSITGAISATKDVIGFNIYYGDDWFIKDNSGTFAHAEGEWTTASGLASHAEGSSTTASGNWSHAEGAGTTASGGWSHAEGQYTTASNLGAHAEGLSTIASGTASHAEGASTIASGDQSHAEGFRTVASGFYSHAAGRRATAAHAYTYIWSDSNLGTLTQNVSTTRTGQYMVSASGGVFIPGNVGIGGDNPASRVHIFSNDALIIPVGNTSQRVNVKGAIRYNSQLSAYEGYGENVWGTLGGVRDTDQDTYIIAEDSPGADNDQLKFFTAGTQRAIINEIGNVGIGTSTPNEMLTVTGNVSTQGLIYSKELDFSSLERPSLTGIKEALDTFLYTPVAVSYVRLNGSSSQVFEVGQTFSPPTVTWISNKPEPQAITQFRLTLPNGAVSTGNRTYTSFNDPNTYVINLLPGSTTNAVSSWSVQATDWKGTVANGTATANWLYRMYFGSTASTVPSTAEIFAGAEHNTLATTRTDLGTRTVSPNAKYFFVAYPKRFGATTMMVVNNLNFNDFTQTEIEFQNSYGAVTEYYVYRSNNLLYTNYNIAVT